LSLKGNLRLILLFSFTFSLGVLAGPMATGFHLPAVPLVNGCLGCNFCQTHTSSGACADYWYPAGPAMNTLQTTIFTDETAEFTNIQSASPSIDLTDSPLPDSLLSTFTSNPNFLTTAAEGSVGYYEVEFHLANNFWGCDFNFGNSACGIQIRQGISHMIDKNSFVTNEAAIAGHAVAIDNSAPTTSGGGLPLPNPCGYDGSFPQTGPNCVVDTNFVGGLSYHLAAAAGANGYPWLSSPGSADLNAAAQHFVNAGIATGFNSSTSVLTGVSAAAASSTPNIYGWFGDIPRFDLVNSLTSEVCYLFTGSYTVPCAYFQKYGGSGPVTPFPGFTTSKTAVNLNWGMYIAAFAGPIFYDGSLYRTYNSHFVSGIPSIQTPAGLCDPTSVPTESAANYLYACDPAYDSLSSQMELAPCLTAQGDPVIGATSNMPTSPGNGLCAGTTQLSSLSAGIQAEVELGSKALTIPVFETTVQYGYLNNGWIRVQNNSAVLGLANYFTWLDGWNPVPVVSQTIRQGFAESTRSLSPYVARTPWDLYIMGNVYDSLYASNPETPSQFINWMTISTFQLSNSSLNYPAPAHTLTTYRFTLRPDLYFQDGKQVTAYDVAFSYLSMVGSGSVLGAGAASMTGVTILGPHQFDISVSSLGIFTLPNFTGIPILPGRYWTNAGGSAWDSAVAACTTGRGCGESQYTLSGPAAVCDSSVPFGCSAFPASLMTVTPADVSAAFDPIAAHIFVGSGPWQCGVVTTSGSGHCAPGDVENPLAGQSYTLTRFGAGVTNCQQSTCYFRSSSSAALWIWSEQGGSNSFNDFEAVVACFGQQVNLTGTCSHWQQGIGNPGTGAVVGLNQVTIANRFYLLNWVAPFDWATSPPQGVGPLDPVLYEGPVTLSPSSVVGCPSGYDC
jgi:extracellular solute-binding protein (family 5)